LITKGVLDVSGIILNILVPHRFFSASIGDAVDHMSAQFPSARIIWASGRKESLINKAEVVALAIGLNYNI
ncbi:MAG: hypothetical protein NTU61_03745, partial [Candidatus Altiarchaeota archaeon]|nr:hypothetical protein [Candidatus Altiarchaeota archaeon]